MVMKKPKSPTLKKEKPAASADHFSLYRTPGFYMSLELDKNEKKKTKFIHGIETMVRTSFEYRNFLNYLKREADLTYCTIMRGLDDESMERVRLEIHHYPFTLYDLTETVLNKYLMNNQGFTRLSIANEVMELHYALKVGLVPLTITAHQLAHSGGLIIDFEHVHGDFDSFRKEYSPYMSEDAMARFLNHKRKSSNKALMDETNRRTLSLNPALFALPEAPKVEDFDDEEVEVETEDDDPPF